MEIYGRGTVAWLKWPWVTYERFRTAGLLEFTDHRWASISVHWAVAEVCWMLLCKPQCVLHCIGYVQDFLQAALVTLGNTFCGSVRLSEN